MLLGPFTFSAALTTNQVHTPTWHFAGVVFCPFLIWTWTGVFSSTWTCKGGDEQRFFMALLPQMGKGNAMKGNLWIRKLEITTFPSVFRQKQWPALVNIWAFYQEHLPFWTSRYSSVKPRLTQTIPLLPIFSAFNLVTEDQTQLDQ